MDLKRQKLSRVRYLWLYPLMPNVYLIRFWSLYFKITSQCNFVFFPLKPDVYNVRCSKSNLKRNSCNLCKLEFLFFNHFYYYFSEISINTPGSKKLNLLAIIYHGCAAKNAAVSCCIMSVCIKISEGCFQLLVESTPWGINAVLTTKESATEGTIKVYAGIQWAPRNY